MHAHLRRYLFETGAVLGTASAAVLSDLLFGIHAYLVVPCMLAWVVYFALRVRRDASVLVEWGLRFDNLRSASLQCAPILLLGAGGMLAYTFWRAERLEVAPSFVAVVVLYPIWGLAQQWLLQGVAVGNMRRLGAPPALIVLVVAALFGMAHAPDWRLAGLCAVAGAVWTALYLRVPNIIPLGLCHGWLGALAYYLVLGRDPLRAVWPG